MSDSVLPPKPTGPSYQDAPPPPPPPATGKTNGYAITSLVLAIVPLLKVLFGFALAIPGISLLLSVIFGVVALRQIRRTGDSGRGLAIAGLALCGAWLLTLIITAGNSSGSSSEDAAIDELSGGGNSVFSAEQGECFSGYDKLTSDIAKVSCDVAHADEIYAVVPLPESESYPGEEALTTLSRQYCTTAQSGFFVDTTMPADLVMGVYYPPAGAWQNQNRSVVCTLESKSGVLKAPVAH
ncbi:MULTISPECIES: DUF4190 domain-containing protein [unclassified Amycolatopsis]|uniref:DUF4190 domain-containing protein n=1 Tax=unclassified Amycolatopsis TaxID=2618356 RepID=UPI001C6A6086|nr:DUF4190 domain-containing protein [Amycolatopsis sp. DSM 110486]QYN21921.1 DUF4190 domain-containing protein [Amycolatopsis sp. DSM 110486]